MTAQQGITVLSGCQAVSVDLDQKYIKVKRISAGKRGNLEFGSTTKVKPGRAGISTDRWSSHVLLNLAIIFMEVREKILKYFPVCQRAPLCF